MRTIYTNLKWRSPKTDLPENESRCFFYVGKHLYDGLFYKGKKNLNFFADYNNQDMFAVKNVVCWSDYSELMKELKIGVQLLG